MNINCFAKRGVIAAGVLFLCAASGLADGQTTPPAGASPPPLASSAAGPRRNTPPPDFLAGLTLTDDQKAKIEKIRQDTKSREEALAKDTKLSPDVKDAMRFGYYRIENSEIFEVLTPEQQKQVRKRMSAYRASTRQGRSRFPQRNLMPPSASQQQAPAQPVK